MRTIRHHRGFTLLEMMAVVAIVGILSSIAVLNIQAMAATGKVNGGATTVARLMSNARLKAITMHCPVMVQINGPTYVPPAGYPFAKHTAYVILKGNCNSTVNWFETGDKVLAEFAFEKALVLQFPVTMIAGGTMAGQGVTITFPGQAVTAKGVAVDTGGGFADLPTAMVDIQYSAGTRDAVRHTYIPDTGLPYCD